MAVDNKKVYERVKRWRANNKEAFRAWNREYQRKRRDRDREGYNEYMRELMAKKRAENA